MRFLKSLNRNLLFVIIPIAIGCEGLDITSQRNDSNAPEYSWAESEGARNSLQRMSAMANVSWKALHDVPLNKGQYLGARETFSGIPYSSTKEINKYIGIDVSFYTFLTAASNPYSVLYTENIGEFPYHGVNCACYYGTVCSASVSFALGFKISQPSMYFPELDGIEILDNQDISSLKACDIIQSFPDGNPGHVFMVYRVIKDKSGDVSSIILFEAGSIIAKLKMLTAKEFSDRIKKDRLVAFRYKYLDQIPAYDFSEHVLVTEGKTTLSKMKMSLCPSRGDRSVYRLGETVEIDVFDTSYEEIVLKGPQNEYRYKINGIINQFKDLAPGYYKVYLESGENVSDYTEFVLADPRVNVSIKDKVHIEFDCDYGIPSYCVVCVQNGGVISIHDFSDEDISNGFIDMDLIEGGPWYYKVVFDTDFGTVINNPIRI